MHIGRWTQRPPMRRQSSQPVLDGSTSLTRSRCVQVSGISCLLFFPRALGPRHGETHAADVEVARLAAASVGQRETAADDAFTLGVGCGLESQFLSRCFQVYRRAVELRAVTEHL